MPTSMLQPAKVLGEVDEGTLLHELQNQWGTVLTDYFPDEIFGD